MRMLKFSGRVIKEILRDPITLFFGLGFPLVILILLSAIRANAPAELFAIDSLAPGIAVFGLSFMTLFSAQLLSKDREAAFLQRLYTTPLTALDFILGYILPMLPIILAQSIICYVAALALGLTFSIRILYCVLFILPISLFFVSVGLLCGSVMGTKAVGGICGALLTNACAFLSGAWFDLELVGGAFQRIAELLPFAHAVELERALMVGNFDAIFPHLWWVLGYALGTTVLAVVCFLKQMRK